MEEKNNKDIELRSEEAQEIMNKVPPAIFRYGMGTMLGVVLLLIAGSAFFRYPETVKAEFTLTSDNPPAYIQARTSGRIEHLYVANGQKVKEGEILAVIENLAETDDVLELDHRLDIWLESGARTELLFEIFSRKFPRLGNVQSAYSNCLSAWNNYLHHMNGNRLNETELNNAIADLIKAIEQWKTDYLAIAPIEGKVAFMQLWKKDRYTTIDETMFVIVADGESVPIGKASVPMQGIGKVKTGQRAIVRLDGFSEQEYGLLEGEVASISPVPDKENNYIVEIIFPKNMNRHYEKELSVLKVIKGTVEIITRDQSLLEVFFKH